MSLPTSGSPLKYLPDVHLCSQATLPAWFPASQSSHQVAPAVVLHHHAGKLSLATVQDSFARFLDMDDVFQEGFTHDAYLLIQTSDSASAVPNTEQKPQLAPNAGTDERIPLDLADYLKAKSLVLCFVEYLPVAEGPYFVVGNEIHQAWRLFPDQLGAFATTVVPDDTTPVTEKGSWYRTLQKPILSLLLTMLGASFHCKTRASPAQMPQLLFLLGSTSRRARTSLSTADEYL